MQHERRVKPLPAIAGQALARPSLTIDQRRQEQVRILQLARTGLSAWQIAVRRGISTQAVTGILKRKRSA